MEDISDKELLEIQSKELQRLRREHAEMQGQQDLMLFFVGFLAVLALTYLFEAMMHVWRFDHV